MEYIVFVIVGIVVVAFIYFFWFNPNGRLARVAFSGFLHTLYLYLHPGKETMASSLEEARARKKQGKE